MDATCSECHLLISFDREQRNERLIEGHLHCLLCAGIYWSIFQNRWLKLCQTLWEVEQEKKRKMLGRD